MKCGKGFMTVIVYIMILSVFAAATYWTNAATTTVAQMIPVQRQHTVVIDAGHGGIDGGAVSCTGIPESRYNLQICLILEDLFHLLGYRTVMIRRTDVSVYTSGDTIAAKKVSDLRQRVKIVNETENALLISIHQNTFSDDRYSGAQVFYRQETQSSALAALLQDTFATTVNPGSNRKTKVAEGVYLMQHISCPAILVECGFLSNQEEEAKLRNAAYQRKLCCVISCVTAEFLTK